jgi:hypothetical protein
MGQRWENLPWRHWTVSYSQSSGECVEEDVVARDMGEAMLLVAMLPGMTVAPGPYAESAPD